MYDVIVIGCGPAGLAAALVISKQNLHTLIIAAEIPKADQALSTFVSHAQLLKQLSSKPENLEVWEGKTVTHLDKNVVSFSVETKDGKLEYARAAVVASGDAAEYVSVAQKDTDGKIKVNAELQSSVSGIFAAGKIISSNFYNTEMAMADGVRAGYSVMNYLKSQK